jgi:hypothetical protein
MGAVGQAGATSYAKGVCQDMVVIFYLVSTVLAGIDTGETVYTFLPVERYLWFVTSGFWVMTPKAL